MPFTLFHIGPGVLISLLLSRYVNSISLLISTVFIDIEPLLHMIIYGYIVHGFLHTIPGAVLFGLVVGYLYYISRSYLSKIRKLFPWCHRDTLSSCLAGGVIGSLLHVFLDAPLYRDLQLLPLIDNPLYHTYDLFSLLFSYYTTLMLPLIYAVYFTYVKIKKRRSDKS